MHSSADSDARRDEFEYNYEHFNPANRILDRLVSVQVRLSD